MRKKIKVGVIGVGNCFAGLIQGIEYYRQNKGKKIIGLMHEKIGPYNLDDIEFSSAFDVGENKAGKRLDKAVYASPNMVKWLKLPKINTIVREAPALDGIGIYVVNKVNPIKNPAPMEKLEREIEKEIKKTKTEILINYLPVGSQKATEFWAEISLETKCALINCLPVFIASIEKWAEKFKRKKIPIIGDDVKGQIGATIVHRILAKLCSDRGTVIDRTYQINVGGNTDFLNMKEQTRLESKRISKTQAVTSQLIENIDPESIYIGPSDFIPFLGNKKLAFIRLEGKMFADIPFSIELRLDVDDKANSAGIVIDAIRLAKLGLDRKIGGPLIAASAYLMKHPPTQFTDEKAREMVEKFIIDTSQR
ncbi:MAG TPA: inositol-3-phosphate synthase [Candidatus Humimicrobiaceae bacterium]|nr:inositol-3-phosphate synthase [Candidatus Humimicrobiaceae bacterium]